MLVEVFSIFIFGLHHDGHCRDFVGILKTTAQSINQQKFAQPLCINGLVTGKPPDERNREFPIARQLLFKLVRQLAKRYYRRRERVIAANDGSIWLHKDKRRGNTPFCVLSRQFFDVAV